MRFIFKLKKSQDGKNFNVKKIIVKNPKDKNQKTRTKNITCLNSLPGLVEHFPLR